MGKEHEEQLRRRVYEHQVRLAMDRYHSRWPRVSELYRKATNGKSNAYANRLTDYALAICGHPYFSMPSNPRLSKAAATYLNEFIELHPDSIEALILAKKGE